MIKPPNSNFYKRCVDTWGVEAQLDMVIEECLELALEVQRDKRGRTDADKVAEEAADVFIVLHQLIEIVGEDKVQAWVDKKAARVANKLEKYSN
jgi:NTP pyrophosphatase (non-canonical NTP hydrolase)